MSFVWRLLLYYINIVRKLGEEGGWKFYGGFNFLKPLSNKFLKKSLLIIIG